MLAVDQDALVLLLEPVLVVVVDGGGGRGFAERDGVLLGALGGVGVLGIIAFGEVRAL